MEVGIPIALPPGSSESPVAFINNIDLFAALVAGETYVAPDNVVEIIFNVNIDPAVYMTEFQIRTNGEPVVVTAKLEDVDTTVDLTVILLNHTIYISHALLNNSNAFGKKLFTIIQRYIIV